MRCFVLAAGVLLLVTAGAKSVSSFGRAGILAMPDPIFQMPMRSVLQMASIVEFTVALVCILGKRIYLQAAVLAWLSSIFAVYRLALWHLGYHKPCNCMGNLTDALHISPGAADLAMKMVLGYLLLGSYAALFWLWERQKALRTAEA